MKLLSNFIIFFAALITSINAYSVCNTNIGGASPQQMTVSQPVIVVQRDVAIGSTIETINLPDGPVYESCSAGDGHIYYEMKMFTTPATTGPHIYNTNLPGVGILFNHGTTRFYDSPAFDRLIVGPGAYNFANRQISFIKTGAITSGVVSSGLLGVNYGDDNITAFSINFTGNSITQLSCSITTPVLTFPIGDVLASKFGTSVGTIPSGAENTQNLGLDCDADANINVSLSGTQNPDVTTDSVLALTGQGNSDVAKGVGVQLLYNNTPLKLNNNIVLKKSTGGQETFPIVARYYQTKTSVTTGKANASATLNLTYQ